VTVLRRALACAVALVALVATPAAAAPTASFDVTPANPIEGDTVQFRSTSSDPVSPITTQEWDLDGDGTFEASGATASRRYTAPATITVTLRVTNAALESTTASRQLVVAANQLPAASFTSAPANPVVGAPVTLTSTSSDPDGRIVSHAWDLDNDGLFDDGTGPTVTHRFATGGSFIVRLQVTDDRGGIATAQGGVSVNVRPTASMTFVPTQAVVGDAVTFTSTSTDPDGSIARADWDFDGDGLYDDATGAVVTRAFSATGPAVVWVQVTDDLGATAIASGTVTVVANRVPTAAFTVSPSNPVTGTTVTFTSTSTDADGVIASHAWDLDADGVFDDGRGSVARRAFATAGEHVVSLRTVDDRGAADVAFQSVVVDPASSGGASSGGNSSPISSTSTSPPVRAQAGFSPLNPFPIVHVRGKLVAGGALFDLFQVVQLARGTRVELLCRGRGCPFTRLSTRPTGRSRRVRFRRAENRRIRSGVVLVVRVTHPSRIGKYTSFRVRSRGAPSRKDRCLIPGRQAPRRCVAA
jgi:PKD repeat protein